uniref:Uncharacterized protein n=1 Tax=Rhipicephalus microplus TaxID=6941 RepID=A0A6G5AFA4_RHIMP
MSLQHNAAWKIQHKAHDYQALIVIKANNHLVVNQIFANSLHMSLGVQNCLSIAGKIGSNKTISAMQINPGEQYLLLALNFPTSCSKGQLQETCLNITRKRTLMKCLLC